MGREARLRKDDRECPHCRKTLYRAHADDMREHVKVCKRIAALRRYGIEVQQSA